MASASLVRPTIGQTTVDSRYPAYLEYRLSRSENLVPVLTCKSKNGQQNIVKKREQFLLFSTVFSIYL